MIFIIKQHRSRHGFQVGLEHIRTEVSDFTTIPRVGDTVTFPAYRPGMEVKLVEFNYEGKKPVELHSVTVWVG